MMVLSGKTFRILLIAKAMIFTTLPGGATNYDYSFNHITVKEGLSQSTVLSIYKDSKGFMWFGTRTGLNRYDGKDFKVFLQDPTDSISLNFGFFLSISEDSLSNLWVGSQAGVYRYDRTLEKFQLFLHQPDDSHSLASNIIRKILIDSKGLIWICHTKGVDLYDQTENRFIHVLQELENGNEIDPEKIYSIEEDAKGRIWISSNHCLYHLMWEERKIIGYDVSQEPELINADAKEMFLFSSSTGKLWAVHQRGLIFYFDEPSDQFLREEAYQSHLSNTVECLGEDFDHNLLIGTSQEGLYVFNDHLKTVTNYTHSAADPKSLSTDHLYSICTDSDGTIWIGTWNSGVNYTHKYLNNFSTIVQDEHRNSLLYNNVKSIFEDSDHHMWFGTSKGLSILDPETGKFDNYLTSTGNDQHCINTVNKCCETDPGIYWIGTSMPGGIFLFNKARKDIRPLHLSWDTDNILDGLAVFSIDKDKHGIIWIGAINGVYAVDCLRQKIRHFSTKNSRLPSDVIRSSFLDSKGLLWFGTSKGFCSYNPEINDFDRYKSLDIYHRSSPEWIFSFCEDKTGDFWIGSAGYGLILLDRNSGEIMKFTTEQGLTSNVVTGILEDKNGYLWISTYNGISKFNPVEKQVEQNYSIHDGMESNCFNENSQLRTSEGLFYFGGIHGVTYFDPSQFTKNPVIPELVITDLLIFNTPVEIGAKGSPLKKSISETSQIKLKHDQNSISFQFVSLNFINPMKNRYLCFLDGYDEDWHEPLSPGTAHYNNLDPGTYTFRIKGSNNDGLWNESGSVLLIEILPPLWRTQLAYLIYIISFLGLLFFYSRFIRIREEEKRMIHQERLEKEKIKDLNQARLQFFTNIAHDFRLPLSLITGPVEELKNYYSEDRKFTNLVQLVSHNAKRLLTLANEILTFRKMGTGQLELHLQQGDFILFLHHIIEEFRPLVDRRGIVLTFHSFETHFGFCFDKEKMERVLYNLLDNACKHTPENGEICIKVTSADPDHQTIEVSIFNTGKCIPKKDSTKIFDSFYQINDERDVHNRGYGIGLTLVRGIIELHKGNIKLRIVENRGNEFIFTLPAIKGMEVEEVSSVTLEEMIQNPHPNQSQQNQNKMYLP